MIDAHESPGRIQRIIKSLVRENVRLFIVEDDIFTVQIPSEVHDEAYVEHLRGIFQRFVEAGLIEEDSCALPECFPHRALLQFPQNLSGSHTTPVQEDKSGLQEMASFNLPKDPFAHLGYYSFDLSAGISRNTFKSIIAAVDLALKGVDMILDTTSRQIAFALCRPPGHHACHSLAGGYCYINNIAVAAEYLLSKLGYAQLTERQSRVVILDLDFHHGNGTQSIFYSRREPAYVSVHGEGEYPYYTGSSQEEGCGEGGGYNRNFPLPAYPYSSKSDYFQRLDAALAVIQNEWKPAYLLLSMGFDTFKKDILGGFDLDRQGDYEVIGRKVKGLGLPTLALLEGGYSQELGDIVAQFLAGLKDG